MANASEPGSRWVWSKAELRAFGRRLLFRLHLAEYADPRDFNLDYWIWKDLAALRNFLPDTAKGQKAFDRVRKIKMGLLKPPSLRITAIGWVLLAILCFAILVLASYIGASAASL